MSQAAKVKVGNRYQIGLPSKAGSKLKIESADRLLVDVQNGVVVLILEPKDYVTYLSGLHKTIWAGADTTQYLQEEREAWRASNNN